MKNKLRRGNNGKKRETEKGTKVCETWRSMTSLLWLGPKGHTTRSRQLLPHLPSNTELTKVLWQVHWIKMGHGHGLVANAPTQLPLIRECPG